MIKKKKETQNKLLTEVKAIDGVRVSPLYTAKCQKETRVTSRGEAFLEEGTINARNDPYECILTKLH